MSRRIDNVIIIEEEPDDICQMCGAVEETRPYGPGYSRVCFNCAMKDEMGSDARMAHLLYGGPDPENPQ